MFDYLTNVVIPELVRNHGVDQPLRVWIAGCSTGEETYSLAMLLREEITSSRRNVKLQIFASDVDADAVALAREGLFADSIAAEVSAERLARFFSKEERGYKVSAELRANVVFTVQDVFSDPPFSRIDLISCRNLLILPRTRGPGESDFAAPLRLRQGGLLLLGSSETAGNVEGRFEIISKQHRLYRRVGRARPGDIGLLLGKNDERAFARPAPAVASQSRQTALAELARNVALKAYAPALVLINRKMECLYFLGPTDRYLHHAEGHPTNDLMGMVPRDWRIKLRAAIQQARPGQARVSVEGALADANGVQRACTIEVHTLNYVGEELLLVGFRENDGSDPDALHPAAGGKRLRRRLFERRKAAHRGA